MLEGIQTKINQVIPSDNDLVQQEFDNKNHSALNISVGIRIREKWVHMSEPELDKKLKGGD